MCLHWINAGFLKKQINTLYTTALGFLLIPTTHHVLDHLNIRKLIEWLVLRDYITVIKQEQTLGSKSGKSIMGIEGMNPYLENYNVENNNNKLDK